MRYATDYVDCTTCMDEGYYNTMDGEQMPCFDCDIYPSIFDEEE